ncbi:MAG: ABC transporter permease [Bacteroidales bacterium]|nr:ABC transporter permease [Bacteroidales bacterium]MBD5302764.1 ABC transporter permease [Bacteroides sp.]
MTDGIQPKEKRGIRAIMVRSVLQIVRRPLMWVGMIGLPLFLFLFITSMFEEGLPTRIPAAIVDRDGTSLSREITQTLGGMQMVDLTRTANSYSEARAALQEGKIYGFFLIPENFEANLLSGRSPEITFYTNMSYFVPGSMLFKTFKATAIYTKAGVAVNVAQAVGVDAEAAAPLLQPINIASRPIGNPQLNYGIYLGNSFIPGVMQLMIMLMTCFSLGQEIKRHTSTRLLQMANGSIYSAVFAKMLPQTIIWFVMIFFMTAWLFKYNGYTMSGSWLWMGLSELLYVLACQGFAIFIFGLLPNLRLSLSICALTGILSFSIAAFSFPEQSMYPAMSIFSWLMPVRYNFLIYADQALAGRHIYYSRIWFAAYFIYIAAPVTVMWRIKRWMARPVYCP